MRVRVDPQRCQGHTLCAMAAPEVFELSDFDGHASVVLDPIPAGMESQVHDARNSCPEQAVIEERQET